MFSSLLFALAVGLAPPQDERGEIDIHGAGALAVSPAGDLWIGVRSRLYVSHDWNESWSEVDIGAHPPEEGLDEEQIDHICFFDAERGILAGYLGVETKNEILRTTDGGRAWARVPLGVPHGLTVRVSDVQVRADGRAWMVASTGVLASEDFGATWRYLADPFEGAVPCASGWFRTADLGVIGAAGNFLNRTTDGGRTWAWLATPIDELYPVEAREPDNRPRSRDPFDLAHDAQERRRAERERRVGGVWCLGDRLLVSQRNRLFQRPFEGEGKWSAVDLGGRELVAAVLDSDRLLLVTDGLRVRWLSSTLELSSACPGPIGSTCRLLASGARGVAFLDGSGCVCTLTDGVLARSLAYQRASESTWTIAAFDRAADGTLFGVSSTSLFRSRNGGQTWERLGEGEWLRDVLVSKEGGHALVLAHNGTWLWRGAGLEPVSFGERPRLDISVQREGPLWIATAMEAAEDQKTQMMLHTSDIRLTGPGFRALLYSSVDEGRSWKHIAEHLGAIVKATWLGDDGFLRLCLSDGTIRGGKIDARDGTLVGGELTLFSSPDHDYGGDWGTWLAFPDAENGWVGGCLFFEGARLATTSDGGRTWSEIEPAPEGWNQTLRLNGGSCARVFRGWQDAHRVELWRDGGFREIRRFATKLHDVGVDASGCLLVRQEDGEVWRLTADGEAWSRVGTIPLPRR